MIFRTIQKEMSLLDGATIKELVKFLSDPNHKHEDICQFSHKFTHFTDWLFIFPLPTSNESDKIGCMECYSILRKDFKIHQDSNKGRIEYEQSRYQVPPKRNEKEDFGFVLE